METISLIQKTCSSYTAHSTRNRSFCSAQLYKGPHIGKFELRTVLINSSFNTGHLISALLNGVSVLNYLWGLCDSRKTIKPPNLRALSCNWIIHYMWQLFSLELDGEINNQGIRSVAAVLLSSPPCGQLHHHSPKTPALCPCLDRGSRGMSYERCRTIRSEQVNKHCAFWMETQKAVS